MRTTMTLDEDVAAKLKAESHRLNRSFKEVLNETLRRGLATRPKDAPRRPPFKIQARDVGNVRPGLSLDNIGKLIEQVEGSLHR